MYRSSSPAEDLPEILDTPAEDSSSVNLLSPAPAPSFWRTARSLLTCPLWLRQQIWTVSTEIVASLLAAIGLLRGLPPTKVALGLAVAYGLSALASLPLARGGKGRLAWVGLFTIAFAVAALVQHGKAGWWWLACALGGLMAFRDSAHVSATAWSPWRARRLRTSPLSRVAVAQTLGILIASLATILSAVFQVFWPGWAALVILAALAVGIPDAFLQRRHRPSVRHPIKAFRQSWRLPRLDQEAAAPLLSAAIVFSSVHLMGRRLLLPLLLVALASRAGWEGKSVLILLGCIMAIMAIIALAFRMSGSLSGSQDPRHWFRRGVYINIVAWVSIVTLSCAYPWLPWPVMAAWLGVSWLIMEAAGRRWSVGYLDSLRAISHEAATRRNRAHRELLTADLLARNGLSAGSLMVGALAAPVFPVVMTVLLGISAWQIRHLAK